MEFAHQANAFVGTFVVKVFTKLRETKVVEQFTAVPEDGQVFEKTKRRICCALPPDAEGGDAGSTAKVVRKFETPESGLVETGLPVASLEVSYDDLVGTRARHWGQREFQVPRLREAGVSPIDRFKKSVFAAQFFFQVSEEMLCAAFPDGIPGEGGEQGVMVDLTEEEEEEVKEEVKQEE